MQAPEEDEFLRETKKMLEIAVQGY